MTTYWTTEQASARLFRAMRQRTEAKAALRAYWEEHDNGCEGRPGQDPTARCYQYDDRVEDWCAVCQGSQPLYEAYRIAATEQGSARRTFMATWAREERQRSGVTA